MNKNIQRIIAIVLAINAFSTISAITSSKFGDIITKPAYASSYSPDSDQLKTLKIKSTNGDNLDLRDGYNGSTVKLSDDTEYYVKLTDDSDGIVINATAEVSDEVVRIFTSDKDDAEGYKSGDKILLGKGDTTIYVRTYNSLDDYRKAKNDDKNVTNCDQEYKIDVRKTQASDNEDDTQDAIYLDNIQLNKGTISFVKQTTSYDVSVDSSVSEIKITAPPEDESDRVRIDGDTVDYNDNYKKTVSLDNGKNEIKVKVTDSKDNQRTYTLNITRGASSDSEDDVYLDSLKINHGNLDFSKDDDDYTVNLDEGISNLTVTAEPEDTDYAVKINGDEVNSDDDFEKSVSLDKGGNTVTVTVEDELNNKKRTYTLTVNRGNADDASSSNSSTSTDTNTSTNTNSSTADKKSQWVQTDKGWQYYDNNGQILKGSWIQDKTSKSYYYLNTDGYRATGWVNDSNKWYLLDSNGVMLTGWQKTDGKWYMLDKSSGDMKIGWYKVESVVQNNNTNATNNSTNTAGTDSYANITDSTTTTNANSSATADNSATNTISTTGVSTNTGINTNASTSSSTTKVEKWYYLNSDGSMKTGWLQDNNKWYYFKDDGSMQKGWLVYSNSKYYLNDDGSMVNGTKTIDGKDYKFTDSGVLII